MQSRNLFELIFVDMTPARWNRLDTVIYYSWLVATIRCAALVKFFCVDIISPNLQGHAQHSSACWGACTYSLIP